MTDKLHKDDTPIVLPDGKVDFRRFKNHFPQVTKNSRLLQKIPRVFGAKGRTVAGQPIEAPLPKDINLSDFQGPGTRVEKAEDGEFLVSTMDGFVVESSMGNRIEINEGQVNRGGISMKTTGDLTLTGDTFEEYGDLAEQRLLKANGVTIHQNVYGEIETPSGNVVVDGTVNGTISRKSSNPIGLPTGKDEERVAINGKINCLQ